MPPSNSRLSALKMSYSRAWSLIDEMNRTFGQPMIVTQVGGQKGGWARLTEVGAGVVRTYRAIEGRANGASSSDVRTLTKLLGNSHRVDTPDGS
jgi:molybdate transport system regulatory protein